MRPHRIAKYYYPVNLFLWKAPTRNTLRSEVIYRKSGSHLSRSSLPCHRLANAAVAKRWLFLGFQYLLFLAVNHLHHCLSHGFQHVLVDVVDVVGNGVVEQNGVLGDDA